MLNMSMSGFYEYGNKRPSETITFAQFSLDPLATRQDTMNRKRAARITSIPMQRESQGSGNVLTIALGGSLNENVSQSSAT